MQLTDLCDSILEEASIKSILMYDKPTDNIKNVELAVNKLHKEGYLKIVQYGVYFFEYAYGITDAGRAFLREGGYKGLEIKKQKDVWKSRREWLAISIAVVSLMISIIALAR